MIRGWAEEDPRALWERLKAEGPVKAPEPREVAREYLLHRWSFSERGPKRGYGGPGCEVRTAPGGWTTEGRDKALGCARSAVRLDALPELPARLMPDASEVDPRELARWARILTSNRLVNPDPVTWTNTGNGGYRFGGEFADPVERLAEGWDLPELPAKVSPGAEAVDPREVARWTVRASWSYEQGNVSTGFVGPGERRQDTTTTTTARKVDALPELPATVLVEAVEPPRLPEGSWVYIDPPYKGTTGYAHDLPREEVVRLARLWREAGAHVCISEAEPIPDLVDEGWHVVEITGDRKGQKRTFSKQKREFLTMSREPRGQLGFWGLS